MECFIDIDTLTCLKDKGMKIFKVPCHQVPELWEVIKFAFVNAGRLEEEYLQKYCNGLLISLLSGKRHVVVLLNDDRKIKMLGIVKFVKEKVTDRMKLILDTLYAWEQTSESEKEMFFNQVRKLARDNECYVIEASSYNPKLWEASEITNPDCEYRTYLYDIGGSYGRV